MTKLIAGQMNILIKKCPTKQAQGSNIKKGYSKLKNRHEEVSSFNTPSLCIVLRKNK